MAEIKILSREVADKIAAGEVAERPSAVVKELVENSIDAGATSIDVEIRKGGIEYIRVCDNGCGIEPDQVETAFLRHATSKLKDIDDLYRIGTMGFRGEALSSICAVADIEVITKTAENEEGVLLRLKHGEVCEREDIACGDGTTMVVKNLFENIPARMKFLKKNSTEAGYVADVMGRIALSHPDIAFSLISDDKEIMSTSGDGNLKNVILKLYGIDHAKAVIPVDYTEDNVKITGLIGKPEISRGNRARQTLFVNERYIKSNVISKVVSEAYRNSIMVGKFPFFVLNIEIALDCVDVNVHPAKTEIKFSNEGRIYEIVYHAVSNALFSERTEKPKQEEVSFLDEKVYVQEKLVADKPVEPVRVETKPVQKIYTPVQRQERVNTEVVKKYLDNVIPTESERVRIEPVIPEKPVFEEEPKVTQIRENDPVEEKPYVEKAHNNEETHKVELVSELPKPIAQVFDTYVLCQDEDILYVIDQHAAHERYRFENLKKSYYAKEKMSQLLLVPMIIKLDYVETENVLSNIDVFRGFGFDIEDFGSGSIIVNATPVIASENQIRDLILEISSAVSDMGRCSLADFEEKALDMIACKYAIKANHKLNYAEMQDIIKKVYDLESDGIKTCPHGRPIKVEITKAELEKMFKRRV